MLLHHHIIISLPSLLLLLLLLLSPLLVCGHWNGRFRRQAGTIGNAPIGAGGTQIVNNNNYQDMMFATNGCVYHNGYITENGGAPRKATEAEQAQVQSYMRAMQQSQQEFQRNMAQQMQQMNEQMRQMFAPPFPFGSSNQQQQQNASGGFQMPPFPQMQMPEPPCFCESCRRARSGNDTAVYNQYSWAAANQQQGTGSQLQQQQLNNKVTGN